MKPWKIVRDGAGKLAPRLGFSERLRPTRELGGFLGVLAGLVAIGLYQQNNMILLVAGLFAGPLVASCFLSQGLLGRLKIVRRPPSHVFAGEPLVIDYRLENTRKRVAALAVTIRDGLQPDDRSAGGESLVPRQFAPRLAGGQVGWFRWEGTAPRRGLYRFDPLILTTRSPFGLVERSRIVPAPADLIVYPAVGRLTRPWRKMLMTASETVRGQRAERSIQQEEYHGLRDYRPGDNPRWIHWRTTARLNRPMIREFEQHHEQDVALILDPWIPRTRPTAAQRESVEAAIGFAATACMETCRNPGRRILLGCTGPDPSITQGQGSVRLIHQFLTRLALLRGISEGSVGAVFDVMPPALLRDAMLIIVSTRPISLADELERSARFAQNQGRGIALGRVILLDASRGDLKPLIDYGDGTPRNGRPTPATDLANDALEAEETPS